MKEEVASLTSKLEDSHHSVIKREVSYTTSSTTTPITTTITTMEVKEEYTPSLKDLSAHAKDEDNDGDDLHNFSPSATPPTTNGTISKSSTPAASPPPATPNARKLSPFAPQLIGDLLVARDAALSTFNEIPDNCYQYKTLGRSRELMESMTCDCTYEHGADDSEKACGHDSGCINRLTQVECLPEDCRCRAYCQNQRFQRKEYADIEIVQTEKKGFGLRAERDLERDTFIYEYVGDVVNPASFKKRMRDYASEGIQHFYFMMLQKDEFIDATKSGGIGRFANHSCSPNCYVAKWFIGAHVRMGIFAKRHIKKHEELTFNYNVDRYGHQAQVCYCGEPNCVGFIGGKTQTDIATMDDLYLDALGITDEDDLMELKGTKKKKGKKIDDPDFMPQMKSVVEKDIPKVVQAIRQTQSKKVLSKLLTRIKMTDDQAALRQIMRLRGYSLMKNVLEDHPEDAELITLAFECMTSWPLMNKNKVEDSQVATTVKACLELDNERLKTLGQSLLDTWEALPMYTRIPKRVIQESDLETTSSTFKVPDQDPGAAKRVRYQTETKSHIRPAIFRPLGFRPPPRKFQNEGPPTPTLPPIVPPPVSRAYMQEEKDRSIKMIIEAAAAEAAANEVAVAAAAAVAAEQAAKAAAKAKERADRPRDKDKDREARRRAKARANGAGGHGSSSSQTWEQKEANKEKRLRKLVGAVVVKCMSKYAKKMERDLFKQHAKELTEAITEKEKKSSSYIEGRLDSLSDEKTAKIKKYSKDSIQKVLRKIEKSGKGGHPGASASSTLVSNLAESGTPSSSTLLDTPDSNEVNGRDISMDDDDGDDDDSDNDNDNGAGGASPGGGDEEAMDMDSDSDDEDTKEPQRWSNPSLLSINDSHHQPSGHDRPDAYFHDDGGLNGKNGNDDGGDGARAKIPFQTQLPSDPRRRPPHDDNNRHPYAKQGLLSNGQQQQQQWERAW